MKAYVTITGVLFALITLAHVARMVSEPRVASEPWFLALTVLAAGLCLWAWRLLRLRPRP